MQNDEFSGINYRITWYDRDRLLFRLNLGLAARIRIAGILIWNLSEFDFKNGYFPAIYLPNRGLWRAQNVDFGKKVGKSNTRILFLPVNLWKKKKPLRFNDNVKQRGFQLIRLIYFKILLVRE